MNFAAWSPDGKRIVTASDDGAARVWDAEGRGAPIVLEGHESAIAFAVWSPDSRRIVTGSPDSTARVWNADGAGAPIILEGHESAIAHAAWSHDGKRLVTASDATVHIWLIETTLLQQALRAATTDCLTPEQRQTYLLESEPEARKAYEACERARGRTP